MLGLLLFAGCLGPDYQIVRDVGFSAEGIEASDPFIPSYDFTPDPEEPVEEEPEVEEPELVEPPEPKDCTNGEWVHHREIIFFPERQDCDWNEGDNWERRNGFLQARSVETHIARLPEYTDLCSLSMNSVASDLEFDDHFTMTLDGWVLVGGGYSFEPLESYDGMYLFDWTKVRGQGFNNDGRHAYQCMGAPESICVVPPTEQHGPFELEFSEAATDFLSKSLDGEGVLSFTLHTFGDNDANDCAHTDVELILDISYVLDENGNYDDRD